MVSRRQLIRQALIAGTGMVLLPACLQQERKKSIEFSHFKINSDQESMLADLSEAILPASDLPGAKDLSAHLFVLKMVNDCYGNADQQTFLKGMGLFDEACVAFSGKPFGDCSPDARNAFLEKTDNADPKGSDAMIFYTIVKKHTIQAFTTSQFYLDNVIGYKMVPGIYHGCVKIKT